VVEALAAPRSLAHTPVFQVMFAWQNAPSGMLSLPGLEATNLRVPTVSAAFDLALELQAAGGAIAGTLTYATALFDRPTIERYTAYWRRMLQAMAEDETQPVSGLPWMDDTERREVLEGWSVGGGCEAEE